MGIYYLFNYGILYQKYDTLLAVFTPEASSQRFSFHLTTFLLAQLQFI